MYLKKLLLSTAVAWIVISFIQSCQTSSTTPETSQTQDTHLGELMGQMQYYVVKLGLALQHQNQPLASFYMNEVNETYDNIVNKKIKLNEMNISDMIRQLLNNSKQRLEQTIAGNDTANFAGNYHALITSCNNCHRETNHAFIIIEEPRGDFNGQNFGVQRSPYSE